jgi:hypothetical protein
MIGKRSSAWWAPKMGSGLAAFFAGLDKFFNILTGWAMYPSPWAGRPLPVTVTETPAVDGHKLSVWERSR